MSTYQCFEDLPVWQKAKDLAILIYNITSKDKIKNDYGLKDQIQRAAVSVSSNIAEGFERCSQQSLVQFLYIAKASCGELRSQIHIARSVGLINEKNSAELIKNALDVSRQINGFILYLKKLRFQE